MQTKARLHDISYGADGKQRVCFTLDRRADLSSLQDKDIRLEATQWREKRSLDANAYFHVLCQKIAEKTAQSLTEAKNQMISDYGQMERTSVGVMTIIMDNEIDWRRLEIHLHPTGKTRMMDNGRLYQVYIVMRGSHTYDTREMAHLIDGTIREAEELGIDTITENQKAEMLAKWGEKVSSKKQSPASSAEAKDNSNNTTHGTAQPTGNSPMRTDSGYGYARSATEEPMASTA